ncbi:MAG: SUMF1/EgtB/PvdO family nonheme iron enzyme [Pseudoxanthomonas suwonensis]|nr:SUMF1/EgtB/PvdO family nonheme iron enzyme [Pseudoxanthomonas suwonensis]
MPRPLSSFAETGRRRPSRLAVGLLALLAVAGCGRDELPAADAGAGADTDRGAVTILGDDAQAELLTWRMPQARIDPDNVDEALRRAADAREEGRLFEDGDAAIPLYLALLRQTPGDEEARQGLQASARQLLDAGNAALVEADDRLPALQQAVRIGAVARSLDADAIDPADVLDYLGRVDVAERAWQLNERAEQDIREQRYGAQGGDGALPKLREVLTLLPGQPRARQGVAAVESGLIRHAEEAAVAGEFEQAASWLELAATVREQGSAVADARVRIQSERLSMLVRLHNEGTYAISQQRDPSRARAILAEMLRIAEPGDPSTADLRQRIDRDTHYGLFRPGQAFTDAFGDGSRGPQMRVVPHGAFQMGAPQGEQDAQSYEQPVRYVRFDRGFAMSVREITVGEFRRYIQATAARTRADRRGHSLAYDERSGNFVRRGRVDWSTDYLGAPAAESMPVLHVSARDADDYVRWLSEQTGQRYRLPSEAEFEYALRAGGTGRFPWGDGEPPENAGNLTGSLDRSPGGRDWSNAFTGYGDGYWGPAPVGSFAANAFGLHDLAGNVSEWVADCWHDNFRRAPRDGSAWYNPGCRTRVIRGGAWANSPAQTRSAWRAPADIDLTNARIGFRVVRDL